MALSRQPAAHAAHAGKGLSPSDEEDQALIWAQLHRLLHSPAFRTSKRSSLFLSHIVEHSLRAPDEPLKERMLGVQVFGRQPSYDTAADPVVRTTAGEIRRRLGLYYADPARQRELRIDLPAGGYAPTYGWLGHSGPSAPGAVTPGVVASGVTPPGAGAPGTAMPGMAALTATGPPVAPAASVAPAAADDNLVPGARLDVPDAASGRGAAGARQGRTRAWWASMAGISAAVAIATLFAVSTASHRAETPFDRFWAPLLTSRAPVLISVGSHEMYEVSERLRSASVPAPTLVVQPGDVRHIGTRFMSASDAMAMARLAALFQQRGAPYQLRENRFTSFDDLRAAPTVLVGMFSNAWTLELGAEFRFAPVINASQSRVVIMDRQHPERADWYVTDPWPALNVTRDFALVSRVRDPMTGSPLVIAAGITPFGTVAAVEWMTSPRLLEATLRTVPQDWPTRNMQVVLETHIVDGTAGPPRVAAVHVW